MKKTRISIAICATVFIGLLLYYKMDFEHQKKEKIETAKAAVRQYLSQQGVFEDTDYALYVDYRLDSKLLGYSGFVIQVTFKDESNVLYNYDYLSDGRIIPKSAVDKSNPDYKDFKHEVSKGIKCY